jgi:ATP-dependent Clp protease ATP-binding subunit ClpC
MFKRFTERARRVIILAREEAERHHHEYLGTEHILLGMLKDGGGIAIPARSMDFRVQARRPNH